MSTDTAKPYRSRLAGEAKILRKVRLTRGQWDALIAQANSEGIPLAEHLRRIVHTHLHQEALENRTATRLRHLERRVADLEDRNGKA